MAVHSAKSVPGIASQDPANRSYIAPEFRTLPDGSYTGAAFVMAQPLTAVHRSTGLRAVSSIYGASTAGSVRSAWTRWALYRNDKLVDSDYSLGYIRPGVFTGFSLYNHARRRLTVSAVTTDSEELSVVGAAAGSEVGEYGELFFALSFSDGVSGPVDAYVNFVFSNGESTAVHISATLTHEMFPFRIDYSENITAKWQNSIEANHLSPAPLGFLDGQQTIRKRLLSVQALASGDDVALMEEFFESIGCDAFWLMDLPRSFEQVSASAESTTLYIESGDLPNYVTAEHAYYMALLPRGSADPFLRRIVSITANGSGYDVEVDNPFDADILDGEYEISLASLVVVNGDTISFEPHTSSLWKVSLSLLEQPYETTDALSIPLIVYRYTFTYTDHLGNSAVYKYTTGEDADGYTALDISHDSLSFGLFEQENKCTISMMATSTGPFAGWAPVWMGPPLHLEVERLETVFGSESSTTIFYGECVEAVRQGRLIEAVFKPRAIRGKLPNFFASVRDNLDQWIEHDIEAFRRNVTLQENNSNLLTVSWGEGADPAILEGGYLVYEPDGALAEVRDILAVTGDAWDSAVTLQINGIISAAASDALACYRGYDGSAETYAEMFGSLAGFGGHPMITTTNPAVTAVKLKSDYGGKK